MTIKFFYINFTRSNSLFRQPFVSLQLLQSHKMLFRIGEKDKEDDADYQVTYKERKLWGIKV